MYHMIIYYIWLLCYWLYVYDMHIDYIWLYITYIRLYKEYNIYGEKERDSQLCAELFPLEIRILASALECSCVST